jgi:hypothetical protein
MAATGRPPSVPGMASALWIAASLGLLASVAWRAWRGHRAFVAAPGTFRCRVRVRSMELPGFSARWSRGISHARWVHDVLVVRRGVVSPRVYPLAVRVAEGELVEMDPSAVRRLGAFPVSVRVVLDDHSVLEVASRGGDRDMLAGPFVVLAVSRLVRRPAQPDEQPG